VAAKCAFLQGVRRRCRRGLFPAALIAGPALALFLPLAGAFGLSRPQAPQPAATEIKSKPALSEAFANLVWPKKPWRVLRGNHPGVVTIVFSPDAKFLAARVCSSSIKLWSVERGLLIRTLPHFITEGNGMAFSPDDRLFAAITPENRIKIYEIKSGKNLSTLPETQDLLRKIAFTPDGRWLIVAGNRGIRYWDLSAGQYRPGAAPAKAPAFFDFAFSPDGRRLAEATLFGQVRIWDLETGARLQTLKLKQRYPSYPAFSADGKQVFALAENGESNRWEAASGKLLGRFSLHEPNFVYSAILIPRENLLLAQGIFGDGSWNLKTGKLLQLIPGRDLQYVETYGSCSGRIFALAYQNQVELREAASGAVLHTLDRLDASFIAFSPDGRLLAVGDNENNSIKVWQMPEALWREFPPAAPRPESSPEVSL
jgi:WD40 repeat protein